MKSRGTELVQKGPGVQSDVRDMMGVDEPPKERALQKVAAMPLVAQEPPEVQGNVEGQTGEEILQGIFAT